MAHSSANDKSVSAPMRVMVAVHDNRSAVMPFIHALRIAFAAQGELEVVDVRPEAERINTIGIRNYLERWKLLPEGSRRADVAATGLRVQKVVRSGNKKVLLKRRIRMRPHDLLVIGCEEKLVRPGIFGGSLATALAEYFSMATLLFPFGSRPFIDETSGTIALKRVVLPVRDYLFYRCAMEKLVHIVNCIPELHLDVIGVHVGTAFPEVSPVSHERINWKERVVEGDIAECIVRQAEELCADLVIMATAGRNSIPRTLTGSMTEQLLGLLSCPLLSVALSDK